MRKTKPNRVHFGSDFMQRYDYTTQRLFVNDDLLDNSVINVQRAQANYLLNVLRLSEGGKVLLFNGRHGEWLGEIVITGRKSCNILLVSITRAQPEPYDLIYLFAPLKKGRLDYMVQKAVEMGVGTLQPVITSYTQNSKINLERLRANIIEAAEQCGILSIAQLSEPIKLDELLDNWDDDRQIIFCDEAADDGEEAGKFLRSNLMQLKTRKLALLIGPEGGFSDHERIALCSKEFVYPISLGPRILRADTAAVAALAILQSYAGDW